MTFLKSLTVAMLPDSALQIARSAKALVDEKTVLPIYVDMVRTAFPEIRFEQARWITHGFSNIVLVLDETWIIRFPRHENRRIALIHEIELLETLRSQTTVKLPHYTLVASEARFAGYRMIAGAELTARFFTALPRADQESLGLQLGGLLSALHAQPESFAMRQGRLRGNDDGQAISAQYFAEIRTALIRRLDPALTLRLDRLYTRFAHTKAERQCLVHSDIDDDHLLWDADNKTPGLIDFGEAALGDPAADFALFATYPAWFAPFVLDHYAFGDDGDFLERARLYGARRLVERLWYGFRHEKRPPHMHHAIAALERMLDQLGL